MKPTDLCMTFLDEMNHGEQLWRESNTFFKQWASSFSNDRARRERISTGANG